MIIKEIVSKTALSPSKLPGLRYALNPYTGCEHQCRYCYVPSVLHIPMDSWARTIYVKRNLPFVLSKELPKKKRGIVGISTVTDPYQPIEKKYHVTRYCLEQLLKYDFPIQIQTKSDLILRDKDLINRFSDAEIMVSIATINETHRKILEPFSSSIQDRIHILNELKNNQHIKKSVFFGPIYPTMTWEEIQKILDMFIEKKISTILLDTFHIKPGLPSYLTLFIKKDEQLNNEFIGKIFSKSDWYQNMIIRIKDYIQKNNSEIKISNAF